MSTKTNILFSHQSTEQTISGDDLRIGVLQRLPGDVPAQSTADRLKREIQATSTCSAAIVDAASSASVKAKQLSGGEVNLSNFVSEYRANPMAFKASRGQGLFDALQDYVDKTKTLLANCYRPAEASEFFVKNHLDESLGSLIVHSVPFCTGLTVGPGTYVLTARHCFMTHDEPATVLPKELLADMWFQPIKSKDRYQLCAVADADAFTEAKTANLSADQVLVRLAKTTGSTARIRTLPAASLQQLSDAGHDSKAPTLLMSFSMFPLASQLDSRFTTGFVEATSGGCAVIAKGNGCFLHQCGVVEGGSGSPLFARDTPTLTLAGSHIGFRQSGADCKDMAKGNIATYSNTELLAPFIAN